MVMHATARCQNINKRAKLGLGRFRVKRDWKKPLMLSFEGDSVSHVLRVGELPHREFRL